MKLIKNKLFIVTLLILVFLFAAEFAVRIWKPQELIPDLLILDKDPCHRLNNNIKGVQKSREYNIKIAINEKGLRDYNYSYRKEKNTYRILMVGDSHTFGWGVKLHDIFSKILERNLNANSKGLKYEVINCGTMGYGTGHQYQFIKNYGYRFSPDLIIIAMDLLHDIKMNNRFFSIAGEQVIRNSKPCIFRKTRVLCRYIPFCSYLRGHSHLFRFAGVNLASIFKRFSIKKGSGENGIINNNRYDLEKSKKIFKILRTELNKKGIHLVVTILPEFLSYDENVLRSLEYFFSHEEINYFSMQDSFNENLKFSKLTFEYSAHFNSAGHRFIAEEIERYLYANKLLDNLEIIMN
ncbi:MAG: hypothetical protein ACE5JB_06335 [bacterium]